MSECKSVPSRFARGCRENFTRVSSCANSPTNSKTYTFEVGQAREKIAGLRELCLLELQLEAPDSVFIYAPVRGRVRVS